VGRLAEIGGDSVFKSARTGLSIIQELDDWILKLEDHRIVFSDSGKTDKDCHW
jgi:hypothetical protein